MNEFTLSAFARYADGTTGDAFAQVSSGSIEECFGAMAGKVADWLPEALAHDGAGAPRKVELTLDWSGAAAAMPATDRPEVPSDQTGRHPSPPRRALRRLSSRRLGCAAPAALPLGVLGGHRAARDPGLMARPRATGPARALVAIQGGPARAAR